MKTSSKALLALLGTVVLWSFMVVLAKDAVRTLPPLTLTFLRFLFAVIPFLPFFLREKPWKKKHFKELVAVSVLSYCNITFFIVGIQYTSAPTSQLIYALIPVFIIIIGKVFQRQNFPLWKIIGVLLGFIGISFIFYNSKVHSEQTIFGSLTGNLILLGAVSCWTFYILFSKKLAARFSPTEIGSTSIVVSFIISIFPFLWEISRIGYPTISLGLYSSALYLGFFGTFLTYILYQYAIKYSSSLTVSLASYIQPIFVTILSIIFLGDRLTNAFIIGSLFILVGVFLTSTVDLKLKSRA